MATLPLLAGQPASANIAKSAPPALDSVRSHCASLIFRFLLLNILAFALLGAAAWEGYVDKVISADQTRLSVAIFIVFMVGFFISCWRAWQINKEIDELTVNSTEGVLPQTFSVGSLRLKLTQRISAVRHIANTLVLLGLIGTVLGFIIALSGVDPDTASDVNSIAPMVTVLIQGMSTALYTTLIGSVLNVWLTANYQLLAGGTVQLMSLLLDRAENNA
ncbi:MAG: MotA/TolQ/ExbB proton channel family protein [Granulosicoccus sp.]